MCCLFTYDVTVVTFGGMQGHINFFLLISFNFPNFQIFCIETRENGYFKVPFAYESLTIYTSIKHIQAVAIPWKLALWREGTKPAGTHNFCGLSLTPLDFHLTALICDEFQRHLLALYIGHFFISKTCQWISAHKYSCCSFGHCCSLLLCDAVEQSKTIPSARCRITDRK